VHIAVYLQALVVALCSQDSVSTEDMRVAEIKVRYAVVLDGAEPFSAEVTCQTDRECDLVDKRHPGIKVTIFRADRGGDSRLKAYCSPRDCVLSPEKPKINLRRGDRLLRFELSEGRDPGNLAVLLPRKAMGRVFLSIHRAAAILPPPVCLL